jgi:hypothetical protein
MGLDVHAMGWHEIDELLKTLPLPTRIPHRHIIVRSDDDVNCCRCGADAVVSGGDGRLSAPGGIEQSEHDATEHRLGDSHGSTVPQAGRVNRVTTR